MDKLNDETPRRRKARARVVLDRLIAADPDARIGLKVRDRDPWQMLVAVVLSAQCTDVKVNAATPALFDRFEDIHAFARARPPQLLPYIKTLGLAPTKARYIVQSARQIVDQHGASVPSSREDLEALPGVGRKSASVILANAFGVPALAVDTHVGRVARRLGLSASTDPSRVEADLEALWPATRWLAAHHVLIWHGRRVCKARRPRCDECPVTGRCPRIGIEGT